jgi:alginate O-acetyltransferase complex protein AlgI
VLFGIIQAVALIYEIVTRKVRKKISKKIPSIIYNNVSIMLTFLYVSFSLIIFRTATFSKALDIIDRIFSRPGKLFFDNPSTLLFILIGCGIMMIYDIQEEFKMVRFSLFSNKNWIVQHISYALLLIYILVAGVFDGGQFIYFSF